MLFGRIVLRAGPQPLAWRLLPGSGHSGSVINSKAGGSQQEHGWQADSLACSTAWRVKGGRSRKYPGPVLPSLVDWQGGERVSQSAVGLAAATWPDGRGTVGGQTVPSALEAL